jgi:hypothetical protein
MHKFSFGEEVIFHENHSLTVASPFKEQLEHVLSMKGQHEDHGTAVFQRGMKAFSRSKSSNEKTYLEEKGTYVHVVGYH